MKQTYTCPRCAERYGDRTEDDSLMFVKNAGYIGEACPSCMTNEELYELEFGEKK